MKKCYSFLMCLFVALSTFLLSCVGGSDAGSGDSKKSEVVNSGDSKKPEDANRCKITVAATTGGKVKISKYLETSELVMVGSEVEVVATPDKGYTFTGWYVGDSSEPVSTDAVFTFIATKNSTLTAHFAKSNTINGHDYVDLGLPSGLKWATCNVGASKPEDYGGYYAWGETEEKSNYYWSTYKWCRGSDDNMTKYCGNSNYGKVDNKTVLDPEDDVAHIQWGGSWRMPTKAELDELGNNCTWTWTTQNGVNGYNVTGPNGNSIFLPVTGRRLGTEAQGRGSDGGYWSSLSSYKSPIAVCLFFDSDYYGCGVGNRSVGNRELGLSVRPVSE